jgi:hypothetical protein
MMKEENLQLRGCSVPVSTLRSSVFARLASGAFYETTVPATLYEIINLKGAKKSGPKIKKPPRGFSPLAGLICIYF